MQYRSDIDALRGVSIIAVLMFHYFPHVIPGGYYGVDIFFVISGFVITNVLIESSSKSYFYSLTNFYIARIRRILPSLILLFIFCLLIGHYFLYSYEYKNLAIDVIWSTLFLQNINLARGAGYFAASEVSTPLLNLWSLSIEEQFYIIFPFLFLYISKKIKNYLVFIIIILFFSSFSYSIYSNLHNSNVAFFSTFSKFWELASGSLCFLIYSHDKFNNLFAKKRNLILINFISIFSLLLILIPLFIFNKNFSLSGIYSIIPVFGAFLYLLFLDKCQLNFLTSNKTLIFFGLISFPLYLFHWPLYSFSILLNDGIKLTHQFLLLLVLFNIAIAYIIYKYIEVKFRKNRYKLTSAIALLGFLAFTFICSCIIYINDGYPSRAIEKKSQILNKNEIFNNNFYNNNCRNYTGAISIEYCLKKSTANTPADVALIGDSHALSLYPGLSELLSDKGQELLLLGGSGCVPYYDVNSFVANDSSEHKCLESINQSLDFIAADKNIKTIIFSSYVVREILGDHFGYPDTPKRIISYKKLNSNSSQYDSFYYSARNTFNILSKVRDLKIIVLFDWPELGFDPKKCFSRLNFSLQNNGLTFDNCSIPLEKFLLRSQLPRELFSKLENEYPNIKFINSYEKFCDAQKCFSILNDQLLYLDSHHLSKYGSQLLSQFLISNMILSKK